MAQDDVRVPTAPGLRSFGLEPPAASQPEALVPSRDGWPADGSPLDFEDISQPIIHAIRCAYSLERKDRRRNIPWHGPEIGKGERACSPLAAERLKAGRLSYAEDDQGRDALEEIVGLAIQLGIEQGRRVGRSTASDLLDDAYGAKFTVAIGWNHTSVHTESGLLAVPSEAIGKAVEALQHEAARLARCPRHKAVCAQADRNPEGGDGTAPSRSDESTVGGNADAPEPSRHTSKGI